VNKVMRTLTHAGLLVVLSLLVGSAAYAEPNVGVCDVLQSYPKGLYGLCVAFCEAQDCVATFDEATQTLVFPKNCTPSSASTLAKYESRRVGTDAPPMPCINDGCPCWSEAEMDAVADGRLDFCEDSMIQSVIWGRDLSTNNVDYAAVAIDPDMRCAYLEQTPLTSRYMSVTEEQYLLCRNSIKYECENRGVPLD